MTVIRCDLCKKDIRSGKIYKAKFADRREYLKKIETDFKNVIEKDLCADCYDEIMNMFKEDDVNEED